MADDVFHHDNRVVHQDADGEDQREKRDPVERVAVEVKDQQGQCERRRDGEQNDQGFPPAQKHQDQQGHPKDGDAHVQE